MGEGSRGESLRTEDPAARARAAAQRRAEARRRCCLESAADDEPNDVRSWLLSSERIVAGCICRRGHFAGVERAVVVGVDEELPARQAGLARIFEPIAVCVLEHGPADADRPG